MAQEVFKYWTNKPAVSVIAITKREWFITTFD